MMMMQQIKKEVKDVSDVEPGCKDPAEEDHKILLKRIKEEAEDISEVKLEDDNKFFFNIPSIVKFENEVFLQEAVNCDLSLEGNSKLEKYYEEDREAQIEESRKYFNTSSQSEYLNPSNYLYLHLHEDKLHNSNRNVESSDHISSRVISNSSPFSSEIVGNISNVKQNSTHQMNTGSPESVDPFTVCKSSVSPKKNPKVHRIPMKKNCSFQCEICSKYFVQKYTLGRHMLTHTSNRPFQCEICRKSFVQKYTLDRHMLTHRSKRPFQCEICRKSYVQKSHLTVHMITHTNNHPFQCEICSKSYTRKENLERHIGIHTSNKPFQCEICNKSFARKDYLTKHSITHSYGLHR